MDSDDLPIGRLLSRREALALLGAGGAGLLVGCGPRSAEPSTGPFASPCVVKPESTEGPFFFEADRFRRDIRTDTATGAARPGVPLALTVGVSRLEAAACVPLEGALVDVWHCDAAGAYSGYPVEGTEGQDFLRGVQRTNADGEASFVTIYPGWYPGRAVHIHLKVRTGEGRGAHTFTSQLYFPDALSDEVFGQSPYARRTDARRAGRRRNEQDGLYTRHGGAQLLLSPEPTDDGFAARLDFALDLSDAARG